MGDTVQLSAESLAVGKRVVNRGGTRIRRFVVETPVEESVSLHSEKVILDRRPVTDGRTVTGADFSEKTIEMTESAEEAVVSKTARVVRGDRPAQGGHGPRRDRPRHPAQGRRRDRAGAGLGHDG